MTEPLFLEERRRAILDDLTRNGRVSVKSLSVQLGVSAVTIRQDLRALEDEGLLERTYGGAVVKQIAPAFSGTTAFAITPYLKRLDGLTIVTNSLLVAQQFLDTPRIQVIMPGGRLRRDSVALVGHPESLPQLHLNLGFFGARGLSLQTGITDISPEETEMKRALLQHCIDAVVLIDGTKWGQVTPYTYATLQQVGRIITSPNAPREHVEKFRQAGIVVEVVEI
jgi:DeoR/GlpR family transcriptional regulator of sugar metabolism